MFSYRRAGALIAATTTTAVVLAGVPFAGAAEADQVKIRVANITDFHGRLEYNPSTTTVKDAQGKPLKDANGKDVKEITPKAGDEMGAARIAGIVNYIREQNPNTIVTTSGDNQGGSAFVSAISDDQYTMEFVQAINTAGSAIGNHEFDKGYKDLIDRILPGTEVEGNVIQLGANVYKEDGSREVPASRVIEFDGVKVALVGTTSNLTVAKSSPANVAGLNITDSAEEVNKEAKRLKDAGDADVVIALIHDPAKESSEKLDPKLVDFVFGGDSHVRTLDAKPATGVPYAQSYEYGKVVTDLDFTYDKATGKIVELDAKQYDASNLEDLKIVPDKTVEDIVAKAKEKADELGETKVATIAADFKRGSNPGGAPGTNRGTESTANNMIAQSAVEALSAFLKKDIDFGIMNAGGVREDLAKGDVTYKQAFGVQPFGNSIDVATLSGAAIKEMLENQWQTEAQAEKSGRPRLDMGLSDNVSYTYNPDAERGNKILDIKIDGKSVDPNKDYTVAASSFLFDGGDNFIDPKNVRERNTVGYNDLQAFIDYLETGKAKVRTGQKDVGVVLPEGGLKAGQKNEIKLTSLSYSSEGEPKANTVDVKIGDATASANVDNKVTDADKGYGEQGRATVTLDIPATVSGAQVLTITTDAGTDVSLPVNVTPAPKPTPETPTSETPKPTPETPASVTPTPTPETPASVTPKPTPTATAQADGSSKETGSANGSSAGANTALIIAAVAGVLGLLALLAAGPIDQVLGPIANIARR